MRSTARWGLVIGAVMVLLLVVGLGPRATQTVRATQPDVYQASAGSTAVNVMGFVTGSPVDPAPGGNEAFPVTSMTVDSGPATVAHAAYLEPPTTAQAATGLNNVPVPYATAVDAQCNACSTPRSADADGNISQQADGGRVEASGGKAHAQANLTTGSAVASDGAQTVAPFDQVKTLWDAAILDLYNNGLKQTGSPPCATGNPVPSALSTFSAVCVNDLPVHGLFVGASASDASTKVTTDSSGTDVVSTSQVNGVRLLDGIIEIGSIRTSAHAVGDGTAAGTRVDVVNEVRHVCVGTDCKTYTLTADGICAMDQTGQLCTHNAVNQQLRTMGVNICLLGTATSKAKTTASGTASGVLVQFHAAGTPAGGYSPDPSYYDAFGSSPCEAAAPAPHAHWSGISMYAILGASSAQLYTGILPSVDIPVPVETQPAAPIDNGGGSSTTTTVTTIVNNPSSGGVYPGPAPAPPATKAPRYGLARFPVPDRRHLMLAVFGLLELILLTNLTAMAMGRRRRPL